MTTFDASDLIETNYNWIWKGLSFVSDLQRLNNPVNFIRTLVVRSEVIAQNLASVIKERCLKQIFKFLE